MLDKKFNYCLEKIRKGDGSGLENIYIEYYEKMVLTALSKVNNIENARDIASDIIVYIMTNATHIGYIKNPNAWIFSITRNSAIDYIRKDRHVCKFDILKEENCMIEYDLELYSLVIDGIKSLTEHEQELFIKHYIYGFKYKEISVENNKPIGTIKRQIHEMKEKLYYLRKYL